MTDRPWSIALVALGLAALLGLGVVACSKPAKTLDQAATQTAVGKVVAARVHTPVGVTRCPADIPRRKGERTHCTVTLKGHAARIPVTARQRDDKGTLEVTLDDAVVELAHVTSDLRAHLKVTFHRSFQVACGKGRRVIAPGGSFRCHARDANGRRDVLVTVTDTAGTLHYRVLK